MQLCCCGLWMRYIINDEDDNVVCGYKNTADIHILINEFFV